METFSFLNANNSYFPHMIYRKLLQYLYLSLAYQFAVLTFLLLLNWVY